MKQEYRELVEGILRDEQNGIGQRCMDNDAFLYSILCIRLGYGNKPLKELGELVTAGKLPMPATVEGARRKLQQAHPELRGPKWQAEHEVKVVPVDRQPQITKLDYPVHVIQPTQPVRTTHIAPMAEVNLEMRANV